MSTITQFPSGNTQYRIEFDYLARTFVVVTLVDSSNPTLNRVLEVGRDYRFLNPTLIEMLVDQSGFDIVRIHRQTGTDLVVDFRNGSVLTASDLTNAELQAIHIAEEGRDQTVDLAKEYADAAGSSAGNAKDSEDEARRIAADIKAAGRFGYITRRSFEKGFNITTWNEVLLWEANGEYYRWDGEFPKIVPAGSTPDSTGEVKLGAWVSVGDASLTARLIDYSAGNGDEMIAVKQPYLGASNRTQHDKNKDVINVKDFGAIGDGIADETNAFQRAIDAATVKGGEVKLSPGSVYHIAGVVRLKSNVTLDLSGCTVISSGTGSCFYAEDVVNFSVCNGRIYTSDTYPSAPPPPVILTGNFGIAINNCQRFKLSNLDIRGFSDCGIIVTSSDETHSGEVVSYSKMSGCNVSYCYTGIKFNGSFRSEYISVNSCFGYKNNFAGCHLEAGNVYLLGCSFSTNTLYGLYLKSATNGGHGNASGCSFNHNSGKNILIDSLQQGFMFSGCNIFDDAGSDPYSGMIQFAGCKGITFSGCQIMANIQADGLTASNQFVGCSFYGDRNYQVSSGDGTDGYIVFTNCIQGGGGFKRNLPGVNAIHAVVSANYTTAASPEVLKFNAIGTYSGDKMLDVSTGIFVAKSTGLHTVSFRIECSSSFSITIVSGGQPHSKFTSSAIGATNVCSGTTVISLVKNDTFNLAVEAAVGSSIKNTSNATIYV